MQQYLIWELRNRAQVLARRDNQLLSRTFGDLAAAGSQVEVIIALCSTLLLLAIVLKLPFLVLLVMTTSDDAEGKRVLLDPHFRDQRLDLHARISESTIELYTAA